MIFLKNNSIYAQKLRTYPLPLHQKTKVRVLLFLEIEVCK